MYVELRTLRLGMRVLSIAVRCMHCRVQVHHVHATGAAGGGVVVIPAVPIATPDRVNGRAAAPMGPTATRSSATRSSAT